MKEIKFSIITVTYNSEKTIKDTIESVLQQTYKNYEYIIVDGKSEDNTINIVEDYQDKFEGKLRVISEPDRGIYDAMNKGISMASGDIIGIINSDDWYEKNALKKVYEQWIEDSNVVYYGMMRFIDGQSGKELCCTINHPEYISQVMINHPSTFVSKSIYQNYGAFNCRYKISADYEFMIRLIREKDVKFMPIYEILADFRTGGVSTKVEALMETMKIKKKYGMMTQLQYVAAMIYLWARKIFRYPI